MENNMKQSRQKAAGPKEYVCPEVRLLRLSDDGSFLLAASGGRFEDMENGGDLGGDSAGEGSFSDMGYGGDLGGVVTGGNSKASFIDLAWYWENNELLTCINRMKGVD